MTDMMRNDILILQGDCREVLAHWPEKADLIVTSPPYADTRSQYYETASIQDYPDWFATFHDTFWNILKPTGSLVINIKDKVVNGVRVHYVWKTIQRLEALGWCCIEDYIWHKTNPVPGRWPTRLRDAWEFCFHLSLTKKPYFNPDAVSVPVGDWLKRRYKNNKTKTLTAFDQSLHTSATGSGFAAKRANWYGKKTVLPTNVLMTHCANRNTGHPAAFPETLPTFFIKLLTPPNGFVVDPFAGSGTVGIAAAKLGRRSLMVDNKKAYCALMEKNIQAAFSHFSPTACSAVRV